ncbi:thiolase family protein [Hippea alviniae]|uniref:thiolase family protein n=1 Tax=Hippea alviniae TaxID=1279027 RepID=UPI0003B6AA57|nr:thiolase family protein [Hippea alviniae]
MDGVFVVEPLRSPFGGFGGTLSSLSASEIASFVVKEILSRTGIEDVDGLIMGNVLSAGVGQSPARQVIIKSGLPYSVNALTVNKVCGSGLKSLMLAAQSIKLKDSSLIIAGGMESMSNAPYYLSKARFGYRMGDGRAIDGMIFDGLWDVYNNVHMGYLAEMVAKAKKITRKIQDDYAVLSYKRAQHSAENGVFKEEIVPIEISSRKGVNVVDRDEEPFRVDFEKIPKLKPAFVEDGTITAANASTISDGAAAFIVADYDAIKRFGLEPIAKVVAYSEFSLDPKLFPLAPIGAIEKLLKKTGLDVNDIDLFEINEAFSCVVLAALEELKLDIDRVNVNGGAVSLGHPLGASGARLVVSLTREMRRRNAKYGIAALCIGGGEAVATLFERV